MSVHRPGPNALLRLRKHADYQRVYGSSRKQFSKQMSFFYSVRPEGRRSDTPGARVGLTVGKVLGKAVDRNRIKRRMRECVRKHAATLTFPVDVILHPRRTVLDLEFTRLDREVAGIFRQIQAALLREAAQPGPAGKPKDRFHGETEAKVPDSPVPNGPAPDGPLPDSPAPDSPARNQPV